ncbi:NAD(P)/FAD-dependent oxidoreductase [Rhodococcus sp. ACPA4]|uniref:NADH:ubiquinone reductase (non-electrogenic) n=2 Tax=Nocardiaceae TaxID=85025 RepID=A0A652YR83_NOCGL|nr:MULTISPECIES: NAD(P)/FAD-dependent oxidoreductase [Rhodococcus]NMD63353.1 NAD(P)/FAD-dependent oxidoreductase [Nocardia globerula]NRI68427.1 NAD(P)/FAD-dependent oxidoreductase [Rhodococcus sp. MS16]KJF24497.1 NADH dehydrogenase [Rhodococcus sp. AD45]MDV6268887.1 NAD(P)/FAD-dependent oxidoreductase [Rhodococcus globerulus]MDV8065231.1 NAD(P)/FAD-dependent oxidoreductase [Rhodococcus sp. IEGM 1366]
MDRTAAGRADVDATGHEKTQVVIVGSGFGALAAAKTLTKSKTPFVLISETTEHLFQPLLYQVATGVLSAGEIAPPIRNILQKFPDADVRLGRVVEVNAEDNTIVYEASGQRHTLGYRSLIAATGATQAYFGRDEFAEVTYKLKTVEDAELLRKQILRCFEEAHTTTDALTRKNLLSFVVVGAGATGVELAGQIKELARRYFAMAINNISAEEVTVTMVEGAGVALPAFGGKLSEYTQKSLEKSGVEVVLNTMVTAIDEHGVTVSSIPTKEEKRIDAETVIWSAGVRANDFAAVLGAATGCESDRAGRLLINPDLTVGGFANVYAVGDMTSLNGLPGQSPVAMQGGRHAAKIVNGKRKAGTPFKYMDKGSMSIISRFSAVVRVGKKIEFKGTIAWFMWLAVHVMYMVGFRNRYVAVMSWFGSFIGHRRPHFHYTQEPVKIEAAPPVLEKEPELAHSA